MTIIISFFVFLLLVAGMAIGVIVANKPIKGSCGGLSNVGLEAGCMICGGAKKDEPAALDKESEALFHDAMESK